MPLILGANSVTGGYEVDNSLRFDSGSSDYLSRTPATSGNGQIWTYSAWIKRSNITDTYGTIFNAYNTAGSADTAICVFYLLNNELVISGATGSAGSYPMLLRDVSAWYHIVVAFDTTQASLANRIKAYINGVQISLNNTTYPALDLVTPVNQNDEHTIGNRRWDAPTVDRYYSGYMSDVYLIDGQQLTPTDFGEFDEDSGVWKPIAYEGTYGTNGFFLEFQDSGALGTDTSGNGNDFTVNNLTSIDQTTDTPTNNFVTLNPLSYNNQPGGNYITFSEGNLKAVGSSSANNGNGYSTIGFSSGKFYYECKVSGVNATSYPMIGFIHETSVVSNSSNNQVGYGTGVAYVPSGSLYLGGSPSAYGSSFTTNDIISVAIDADNGAVYFAKNGVYQNSGVPTSGASKTGSAYNFTPSAFWFLGISPYESSSGGEMNFGSPSFTISSGNSDANGYGNFEYAVPSGYYALNTKNLAEYG
jgi:hypothetical protein